MKWWKAAMIIVLIELLGVIPLTVFLVIIFVPVTWGLSIVIVPAAMLVLHVLVMPFIFINLRSKRARQGLLTGILLTVIMWTYGGAVARRDRMVRCMTDFSRHKRFRE